MCTTKPQDKTQKCLDKRSRDFHFYGYFLRLIFFMPNG